MTSTPACVTGPEEFLLQVVGGDVATGDAEDEGAAVGDRDDDDQQHAGADLIGALGHHRTPIDVAGG
jgi:hypothetical protein